MSSEKIVIKGKFTGYYSMGKPKKSSNDIYDIVWDKIIIDSFERIDDYNANELKTGNFIYKGDLKNFCLKTKEDNQLIKQELFKEVLLKDIEIIQSVTDDGIKYVKAIGDFYAKTPYTPPVEIKKNEVKNLDLNNDIKVDVEHDKSLKEKFDTSIIVDANKRKGCFGTYRNKNRSQESYSNSAQQHDERSSSSPQQSNSGCGKKITPAPNSRMGRASNLFKNSWINRANKNHFEKNSGTPSGGCNNRSSNGGCLFFFMIGAGLMFLNYAMSASPLINAICLALFGLFLILASFFPRLRGSVGTVIGLLFFLYLIGSVLANLSNFVNEDWWQDDTVEQRDEEERQWDKEREREEVVEEDSDDPDEEGRDNDDSPITYYQHNHNWKENAGNKRNSKFRVRKNYFNKAKAKRNKIKANPYDASQYWHQVYSSLIKNDQGKLDEICKMYQKIGTDNNLNYNQFADMVVTSIQWIPYVLVLEKSCEESKYDGGFVTEYIMSGKPCLGGIKFGIQSPVEFMSNFKGDCDTRSVLCFMILDKFGYDVAVLVSEQYGHAILGINLNTGGGDYIKHKGKRYYVWETTATGFEAGSIPPDCSNLRYWKPALTNN
ncbi:MAG: hypothetical protein P8L23_01225 [Flavobacteriales bacterium]|nr:hypothetical protein [Flavobacteriales bacterium]